jgi:hypothetical protein
LPFLEPFSVIFVLVPHMPPDQGARRGPRHPPGASAVYLMPKTAQGQDVAPILWIGRHNSSMAAIFCSFFRRHAWFSDQKDAKRDLLCFAPAWKQPS